MFKKFVTMPYCTSKMHAFVCPFVILHCVFLSFWYTSAIVFGALVNLLLHRFFLLLSSLSLKLCSQPFHSMSSTTRSSATSADYAKSKEGAEGNLELNGKWNIHLCRGSGRPGEAATGR
jgi:hypothetical protein